MEVPKCTNGEQNTKVENLVNSAANTANTVLSSLILLHTLATSVAICTCNLVTLRMSSMKLVWDGLGTTRTPHMHGRYMYHILHKPHQWNMNKDRETKILKKNDKVNFGMTTKKRYLWKYCSCRYINQYIVVKVKVRKYAFCYLWYLIIFLTAILSLLRNTPYHHINRFTKKIFLVLYSIYNYL